MDSQLDSIDVSLTKNQISGEELNKKIEEKSDIIILDVRFEEEYLNGHIPAAKLLSMNLISKEKLFNLIPVEDELIIIYSYTDERSDKSTQKVKELGYTNIKILKGGYKSWTEKNLPIEK
ncbi:hypothetical protein A2483_04570 [Candidatus Peregrinibacteria bacterium RIFOXYC2_FULL_33_13]|nr:MAG: hypothetical protein A2229_03445 [Candidatus Peregrinibacteria bacterium RIFOXYA2_FULL_33_7]OGJ51995.1 MAG: hypothetical protein A2483_04570 [Candidatus Peregrinibacteria bacterium RIFOXYC2_FULL_33_13]